jgi:hypothetical protein
MRCRNAQRNISEYVDGTLDARRAAALERHLETCAACREVLEDFRAVSEAASRLDAPEPGDDVWRTIKRRLEAEVAGPAGVPAGMPRRRAFIWGLPAAKFAGAAALVLVLMGAGVVIGIRASRGGAQSGLGDREKYTLAKLDEAEGYYQKAIASLAEAFAAQKGVMPAPAAEVFEKNLTVIDATIQACRRSVLKEPEDLQARNYLLAAYMDKIKVLDTALELSEKNPAASGRTKSL